MCCWHTVCRAPASEPPCSETNGRRVDASVDYCKARGRQAHEYDLYRPNALRCTDNLLPDCIVAHGWTPDSGLHPGPTL